MLQVEFLPSKIGELISLKGKGERISIGNVISAIPSGYTDFRHTDQPKCGSPNDMCALVREPHDNRVGTFRLLAALTI